MEAANDRLGDFLNLGVPLHPTRATNEAYGPSSILVSVSDWYMSIMERLRNIL